MNTQSLGARFNKLPFFVKLPIKIALRPLYYVKYFTNDLLSFLGIRRSGTNILFITGFPKSGTTWVENFVTNIPGYNLRELSGEKEVISRHNMPDDAFKWFPKSGCSSIKTHINPNKANLSILKNANVKKILVMYRDPRDIVVSHYYHVLKHNPWKETDKFYLNYKNVTKLKGLSHSLDMVVESFSPWVNGWFDLAKTTKDIDFYFLSYEELRNNQEGTFANIMKFFEVSLTDIEMKNILKTISKHPKDFNPERGKYGYKSTFRRGEIGNWEWEFEVDENLKLMANKELSQILIRLGYSV